VGCTESRQLSLLQSAEEYTQKNQYAVAFQKLKKAISINPEGRYGIKAFYKIGFLQEVYMKDYEGALISYNEFIRLSKDKIASYEVQKRVAAIYFEQDMDIEKAIQIYNNLIKNNPQSLELDFFYLRVALGHFHQSNFEQARFELQKLIEKFPKSQYVAKAKFEIGNSYFMEAKYDIAIEALKQVVRNFSQSEYILEAQLLMAQCYEQKNDFEEALRILTSLENKYPVKSVIRNQMDSVNSKKKLKKK
jgi:TolA-binding protein